MYCDFIGSQFVGNTLARFLRTANYPSSKGHYALGRVYYVPVEKTEFQTALVEFLTKMDERVPFPDSANTLVAGLHFRWGLQRIN